MRRSWARQSLLDAGADAADLDRIDAGARVAVADAEAFARDSPEPDPATIETQLWADGGSAWRAPWPADDAGREHAPLDV